MPRAHTAVERLPHAEFSASYPGHPIQVARVRHDIQAALDGHPSSDDVVLAVSELATNAIMHTESLGTTFDVHVEVFPTYVWVECTDRGGEWVITPPGDHGGRGLVMIDALSGGSWGTERTDTGSRIVWVRLAS